VSVRWHFCVDFAARREEEEGEWMLKRIEHDVEPY
jgi:hypothetical protein